MFTEGAPGSRVLYAYHCPSLVYRYDHVRFPNPELVTPWNSGGRFVGLMCGPWALPEGPGLMPLPT